MADIRRKRPHYWSDFRDGLSMKSVSTIIFLYFATLAPIVAFGGLLGDATGDRMASIEALVGGLYFTLLVLCLYIDENKGNTGKYQHEVEGVPKETPKNNHILKTAFDLILKLRARP